MKKHEMEAHHAEYSTRMKAAQAAENQGLYRVAVASAFSAWEHIDGMMQYERKYGQREFESVSAIDMVLRYAPLMLDMHSLQKLDRFLKQFKRIERDTTEDLGTSVASALHRVWENHRLWSHLEANPRTMQSELRERLGGDQEKWRSVAESWEKMGLVQRSPERGSYRLSLSTRMGQIVTGKCPSCGTTAEAPKAMLLEKMACPKCQAMVVFVILLTSATSKPRE